MILRNEKSPAHFTIRMETGYTDLKVNTVFGEEETLRPIEFTFSDEKPVEIRVNEVSEFGNPILGDMPISFKEANTQEPTSIVWGAVFILVIGFIVACLGFYGSRKRWKRANV